MLPHLLTNTSYESPSHYTNTKSVSPQSSSPYAPSCPTADKHMAAPSPDTSHQARCLRTNALGKAPRSADSPRH